MANCIAIPSRDVKYCGYVSGHTIPQLQRAQATLFEPFHIRNEAAKSRNRKQIILSLASLALRCGDKLKPPKTMDEAVVLAAQQPVGGPKADALSSAVDYSAAASFFRFRTSPGEVVMPLESILFHYTEAVNTMTPFWSCVGSRVITLSLSGSKTAALGATATRRCAVTVATSVHAV